MMNLNHKIFMALGAAAVFSFCPVGTNAPAASYIGAASCEAATPAVKAWDFSKDAGQWAFVGGWQYSGDATTAWDAADGGRLKVSVDFSDDKDQSWSEVKLSDGAVTNATPIQVGAGVSQVSFDITYDASQIKGDAALKAKVYGSSVKGDVVIDQPVDDLGLGSAKTVSGNMKKAHVRVILEDKVTDNIGHLEISLVGYMLGYKGDIYLDNIQLK